MTWESNLTRIRRFLRDPDGNIWSDGIIKNRFNAAQKDLQRKTLFLDDVQPVHVPPVYDYSYLYDFEWAFLASTSGNYQALRYHQQAEIIYSYQWEPQAVWGLVEATAPDTGYHFTQPFEAFVCGSPGDIVPLQYPAGFHVAKFVAWDKEPIDYLTKKDIQRDDTSWAVRVGEPFAYWRPDKLEDQFCLYPHPSTVVYEDVIEIPLISQYAYTFSFEYTGAYLTGTAENWCREDTTNSRQYVFDWELDSGVSNDAAAMRGMWLFEIGGNETSFGIGQVIHTDSGTASAEVGTILDVGDLIIGGEYGIATDVIEADNNVLFVFSKTPTDIADTTDESDWPDFLQKYAEYGALEALYAADTDGQIQSLRDYWKLRKETGIKAIERFKSLRNQDRDYRMVTRGVPSARTRREPRLPDHYPAVYR